MPKLKSINPLYLVKLIKKPIQVMQFIFGHQLTLGKKVIKKGLRFITLYKQALVSDMQSIMLKIKLHSQDVTDYTFNQNTTHDHNPIKITFYASVRKKNNPNCKLETFLQSVVDMTHDLTTVEALLTIDKDDEMTYFQQLQKLYGSKFKFKIFISEIRHGYQKLHLYDRDLFKQITPSTRMLCDYSDDCYITLKHYDLALLQIDSLYPDNIYFIHTRETHRQHYLGDVSKDMLLLFWIQQAKEPASFFPIFSKHILDIANDYAKIYDTKQEWSPLCNTWICDCYVDIIATYAKRFGADRIHTFDMIEMNPHAVTAPHHKPPTEYNLTPNNLAFIKMLNNESQNYLEGLGKIIAAETTTAIAQPSPKISVIVSVLNMEESLGQALDSVIAQHYEPLELIVIDGGSQDGTLDVIKQYESHLAYWESTPDRGHIDGCNKGLDHASGDLICLLNADDMLAPGALNQIANAYKNNPTTKMISCGALIKSGDTITKKITDPKKIELGIFNLLFNLPLINARFFQRSLFSEFGKFKAIHEDGSYYISNDREFLTRLALNGISTDVIPTPLYHYHAHSRSMTFGTDNLIKIHREHIWLTQHLLSTYALSKSDKSVIQHWRAKQVIVLSALLLKKKQFKSTVATLASGFAIQFFPMIYQINKMAFSQTIKLCKKIWAT